MWVTPASQEKNTKVFRLPYIEMKLCTQIIGCKMWGKIYSHLAEKGGILAHFWNDLHGLLPVAQGKKDIKAV